MKNNNDGRSYTVIITCLCFSLMVSGLMRSAAAQESGTDSSKSAEAQDVSLQRVIKTIHKNNAELAQLKGTYRAAVEQCPNDWKKLDGEEVNIKFQYRKTNHFAVTAKLKKPSRISHFVLARHAADRTGNYYKMNVITDQFLTLAFQIPRSDKPKERNRYTEAIQFGIQGPLLGFGLLEYTLYPETLKADRDRISVEKKKRDNRSQFVVTRSIGNVLKDPYLKHLTFEEKTYVNPKNGTIEKIEYIRTGTMFGLNLFEAKTVVEPQNYETVGGVPVPTEYRIKNGNYSVSVQRLKSLKTPESKKLEKPGWIDDAALPRMETQSAETLKKKVKTGTATAADYFRSIYADMFLRRGKDVRATKLAEQVLDRLKSAAKKAPESPLVYETLVGACLSVEKPKTAARWKDKMKKKDTFAPFVYRMLLSHYVNQEKFEKAKELIGSLEEKSSSNFLNEELKIAVHLQNLSDREQILSYLKKKFGEKITEKTYERLTQIEFPSFQFDYPGDHFTPRVFSSRGSKFLESLEKQANVPVARLLLARAHANIETEKSIQKAVTLYTSLPKSDQLIKEMGDFADDITKADLTAPLETLLDHSIREYRDISGIRDYIHKKIEKQNEERVLVGVEHLIDVLKQKMDRGIGPHAFSMWNDSKGQKIFSTLVDMEEFALSRELFIQCCRESGAIPDSNEYYLSLMKKLLQGKTTDLYRLAKYTHVDSNVTKFLPYKKIYSHLKTRLKENDPDPSTGNFLNDLVSSGLEQETFRQNKLIQIVELGMEKFPDRLTLHDLYGRLYYRKGDVNRARSIYKHLLEKIIQRKQNRPEVRERLRWIPRFEPAPRAFLGARKKWHDRAFYKFKYEEPEDENEMTIVRDEFSLYIYHRGFEDTKTPLIKYAILLDKTGITEDGIKTVEQFGEAYRGECSKLMAHAYRILGKNDRARTFYTTAIKNLPDYIFNGENMKWTSSWEPEFPEWIMRYIHFLHRTNHTFEKKMLIKWVEEGGNKFEFGSDQKDELEKEGINISLEINWKKVIDRYVKTVEKKKLKRKERKKVEELIQDLKARKYQKRKKATQSLRKMGNKIIPVLKKHRDHKNPELRKRVKHLFIGLVKRHHWKQLGLHRNADGTGDN